ncbi:MAG TPA: hypothetical protein DCM87_00125 [Planctomycetes bacterium]|nr:hypothetical protein [Planctomycetota bacterium]
MMREMLVVLGAVLWSAPLCAEDTLRFGSVAIDPGDEAALPVWVHNAETIHGLSLAFSYEGRHLRVLRFAVNEQYVPASAVEYVRVVDVPAEDHAVIAVLFMWDAPSTSSGFPPAPNGEERCIGWIVFGSTEAMQPAPYTILPRNNMGDPPVSNTFAVNGGYSVLPALTAGVVDVRNHNVVRLSTVYARPGDAARMLVEVDHAQPLAGIQMALAFENDVLRLREDAPYSENPCVRSINYCGLPIEALLAPQVVEQFVLHVENELLPGRGWAGCGMVFDYIFPYQDHVLPAGTAQRILAAHFLVAGGAQAGARIPVMFTDGLGQPPIDNKVLTALRDDDGRVLDVVSIAPRLEHGAIIVVGDDAPFRRGYVNEDDRRNIGDAIALLGFLFAGAREPGCLKAADTNDDGKVNIADGIRLLGLLFIPAGPPLPAPSIDCGADPTADALSCAVSTYECGP